MRPRCAFTRSTLRRILRNALLAVTVVASCYLAYGFGRLWAEWRDAKQLTAARQSASALDANIDPMTAALPLAGQWSFGGLDWNFASSTVQRNAIAARFETLQSTALQSPLQQLPDMGADLIEIASMLNVVPEVHEGYRIYRLGQPDLKAELITRDVGGRERAVAAACAYPQTDERLAAI